jgi:hypothetical protein
MAYAPDSIKSQPLCEEWNKQITKALWDKLQTKVRVQHGSTFTMKKKVFQTNYRLEI